MLLWACAVAGCHRLENCHASHRDFVTVQYLPKNTAQTTLPALSFVLHPRHNEITERIYDGEDTITIAYQKKAVLISPQSGSTYQYRLKAVTTSLGDIQYTINNPILGANNDAKVDIQVYY